jgi:hypothetical protein
MTEKGTLVEGRSAHLPYPPAADWIDGLFHTTCSSIHGSCKI